MGKYADVFSKDLGKFSGRHHLKVGPSVIPVVMPDRRTPLSAHPALKAELDRLCKLKVIEPVDMPAPWVSPTSSYKEEKLSKYAYVLTHRNWIKCFYVNIILYLYWKIFSTRCVIPVSSRRQILVLDTGTSNLMKNLVS